MHLHKASQLRAEMQCEPDHAQ